MGQFQFKCPQCGQMVSADESSRGLVFPCPHCEKGIVVPKQPTRKKPILAPISQEPARSETDRNFRAIQSRMKASIPSEQELFAETTREFTEMEKSRHYQLIIDAIKIVALLIVIGIVVFDIFLVRSRNKTLWQSLETKEAEAQFKIKSLEESAAFRERDYKNKLEDAEKRVEDAKRKVNENSEGVAEEIKALNAIHRREVNRFTEEIKALNNTHRKELDELRMSYEEKMQAMKEEFNKWKERLDGESQSRNIADQTNKQGSQENDAGNRSQKSIAEMSRQIKANKEEISRLRLANPLCVLVSSHKQARILETRFRPSGFAKYSSTEQITYVRDMFHCTACNSELSKDDYPCCEVSRKRSFNFWKGKYHDAEETMRINTRIDELLKENEALKKAMH